MQVFSEKDQGKNFFLNATAKSTEIEKLDEERWGELKKGDEISQRYCLLGVANLKKKN